MRILVTGGSGFIGQRVVTKALKLGHEVMNVDLRESRFNHPTLENRIIDVRNRDALRLTMDSFRPSHVIHLASDTDISKAGAFGDSSTTVDGARSLFEAAGQSDGIERLVHVSTQYVVRPGVIPLSDTYYLPYTQYGEAKAESERLLRNSHLQHWAIVRPTIVWGPHHPTFASGLWHYIAKRRYLHPSGSTPVLRTYGYVDNVADQMLAILLSDQSQLNGRSFYLGDGAMDFQQWIDGFSYALTGKPVRHIPVLALKSLASVGEIAHRLGLAFPFDEGRLFRMTTSSTIDVSATLAVAGLPRIDYQNGLQNTVQWLRAEWAKNSSSTL